MALSTKQALINLVAAIDQRHAMRNEYPSVLDHADKHAASEQQLSQALAEAGEAVIADNDDAQRWRTLAEQMVLAINGGDYAQPAFFAGLDKMSEEQEYPLTVPRFNAAMDAAFAVAP